MATQTSIVSDSGIEIWFDETSGRLVVTMTPKHAHYESWPLCEHEISPTRKRKYLVDLSLNEKHEPPF